MSLEKLRDLFCSTVYLQQSLQLKFDSDSLWERLSGKARTFIWIASHKQSPGRMTFNDTWGHIWCDDPLTMDAYATLSKEEKAEVLGFFTFQIHELTHHFDQLTTPYGANIHGKFFREYQAFQRFAPLLLREGVPPGRLVDYDPITANKPPSEELLYVWEELKGIVLTLEALGDGCMPPAQRHISLGWGGGSKSILFLDRPVIPITVHDFLYTASLPEEPGWYLRPSAILETRAVVHALKWILKLFGFTETARESLRLYLESFYPPDVTADYSFLLDSLVYIWKCDFITYLRKADLRNVDQILMIADILCWYALQAPPPMPDSTAVRSSPVLRLFHASRFINKLRNEAHANVPSFPTGVDAMMAMDKANEAAAYELIDIGEILTYSTGFANHLRGLNASGTHDPIFRDHFDRIFDVQHRRLSERIAKGYISYSGMPEDGHPVLGLRSDSEADDLAFDAYVAHERVQEWFSFRSDFLYRHLDAAYASARLADFFGTTHST